MTRRRLTNFSLLAILLVIAVVTSIMLYISHMDRDSAINNRQSAIETTIIWARLAPFPPSAQNFQVDVKGSMFTREFVITFDASSTDLQQWLAASPGVSSANRTTVGSITTYSITPGGGAEFAEVKVDSNTNHVVVRAYWS